MSKKVYIKEFIRNVTDTVTKSYEQDETKYTTSEKVLSAKVVYSDGTVDEYFFNNKGLLNDFDTIVTLREMSGNQKEASKKHIKEFVKMAYYKATNAVPELINSYEIVGSYIAFHEDKIQMRSEILLPNKEYKTVYYKDIKDLIEKVEKL